MIKTDEDALICDLAETYHIYDYRQLPVWKVAVFSYGLKDDARIKMKLFNQWTDLTTLLLATAVDKLSMLLWTKTVDAQKGRNKPQLIIDSLLNNVVENKNMAFHSGKDFEIARAKLLGKENS